TLRESAGGYYCDSFGFSLTQKNGYNYFRIHEKEEELKKLRAEYNRLIYVAATRAENEFYFVGSWGPLSDNSKKQFSDFEVIVSSYYDELRSNDFAKENPHFFKSGAPFDFTTIEPVLKNKAFAACGKNTVTSPDVLIKNAEKNFSAKGSLKFESPVSNRRLPSMLETEGKKEETDASDLYPELNTLIKNKNDSDNEEEASDDFESDELKDELFSSSSFGTLAHEYLCAMLSNVPPEKFSAPVKLYKNLCDSDKEKASEICRKMCIQFSKTKEGMRALNNLENHEFVKPEWGYYYYKDGYLYHGFIDLIFKDDDGKYMIIDYKSNDRINSEKYIEQQRCYRDAAAKMLGVSPKDVKCKLYFLRYDRFCELDFGD
ncbi:MAG: PD-(D/E)XK nuclease family protein, partial [Treponema sp.]|nr:PD-(D/E)XK nuclease family protein [Treponema sp.]